MTDPKRFQVSLTEAQIDALVTTIGKVRISDVHLCRCVAVHEGRAELIDVQAQIRIGRGD